MVLEDDFPVSNGQGPTVAFPLSPEDSFRLLWMGDELTMDLLSRCPVGPFQSGTVLGQKVGGPPGSQCLCFKLAGSVPTLCRFLMVYRVLFSFFAVKKCKIQNARGHGLEVSPSNSQSGMGFQDHLGHEHLKISLGIPQARWMRYGKSHLKWMRTGATYILGNLHYLPKM